MLERIRRQIAALIAQRDQLAAERDQIVTDASEERGEDANLTAEETARFDELRGEISNIDAQIEPLQAREAELAAEAEREQRLAEQADRYRAADNNGRNRDRVDVRVGQEPATYRQDGDHSFFGDLFQRQNDFGAQARLQRHMEERAVGTGAFGALVPPQYLLDQFAEVARAGRPFANLCTQFDLPDSGMTINIPRGTTGTSAAIQASEGASVSETNFDETTLVVNVRTIAGQQTLSRQSLERAGRDTDAIIMGDLMGAYSVSLDGGIITDDGTSGTHLGVLNVSGKVAVTYTDASPTVAEFVPKVADAIQQINAGRFLPPDVIVMHPRRWGWLTAATDSGGRPLVGITAGQNVIGDGDAAAVGRVGTLLGVPVYVDANIPTNLGAGTNEDRVIVARRADLMLWENGTNTVSVQVPDGLQVTVAMYGYSAFTAGRYPTGIGVISGTGLVTPTF